MKLAYIEALLAVADSGSIGAAAVRLGRTQPAVTRQLQQMEKHLGVAVLNRSTKPPTLTPAGRAALAHCRRLIQAHTDLLDSVSDAEQPSGDFRLGVAFGATDLVLGSPIDALREAFSKLKVAVLTGWSSALMRQAKNGSIDAAIVLTDSKRTPLPELAQRAIHNAAILVVAPQQAPLSEQTSLTELGQYDWVLNPRGCWYRDFLQDALLRRNLPLKVAIETFGIEFQLSLVARGVGLGLVPAWAVCQSPHRSQLKPLKVREPLFEITVWGVRNAYLRQRGAVMDVLENAIAHALK